MTNEELIESVLDNIDFEAIHADMERRGITWVGNMTPTPYQIIKQAHNLLKDVVHGHELFKEPTNGSFKQLMAVTTADENGDVKSLELLYKPVWYEEVKD